MAPHVFPKINFVTRGEDIISAIRESPHLYHALTRQDLVGLHHMGTSLCTGIFHS